MRFASDWRTDRADSESDLKNTSYAESARLLADYVEDLPDDDPTLLELSDIDLDSLIEHSEIHRSSIHVGDKYSVCSDLPAAWGHWVQTALGAKAERDSFYESVSQLERLTHAELLELVDVEGLAAVGDDSELRIAILEARFPEANSDWFDLV